MDNQKGSTNVLKTILDAWFSNVLRSSTLSCPQWWYNTSFHTSLKMTPFQTLYGFPPPMVTEGIIPDSIVTDVRGMM
jgi:hypothetical protein